MIEYVGEQLAFGKIGNAFISVSFVGALFASVLYFIHARNQEKNDLKKLARGFFTAHAVSVFGIFFMLMYLIFNHRFEYYYVWQHSNTIMPMRYIFACIWEGQEGSFLLWTIWHCVIGFFLIRNLGKWESPVMWVICIVQAFLASMILGSYFFDYKIGSNPFTLLREHSDFANLPFVQMPDYLAKLNDGRGLNPLLQNYWMVIHPPTLFLGFAATVVPFAFAIGGLTIKKTTEWVKPALPYALFGVMILGLGILMGAAWAYEALSFGGFWAWDPVENASLVPWLTLVGGLHVMLIYLKRGQAIISVYVLIIISFLLILYSTFLTRSGILGESSVHAFTDLGMSGQLLVYMMFFVVLAIFLIAYNWKHIPKAQTDDSFTSREFWMFIGMLVLVISAIQISFTTSIPVVNKILNTKFAPPANVIAYYNSWQVPIATVICILIAIGQFFKYKTSDGKEVLKKLLLSFVASLIIALAFHLYFSFDHVQHVLLLFATVFAVFANADYWLRTLKGKVNFSGASIAHMGLALLLLGALLSNAKSYFISRNILNIDLGKDFPNNENIMIREGDTLRMGDYYVTYKGKYKEGVNVFFDIDYLTHNQLNNTYKKEFTLKPIIQLNERMGNASEPATKRFFGMDIYTHITYADIEAITNEATSDEYTKPKTYDIKPGDTLMVSNAFVYFRGIDKNVNTDSLQLQEGDLAVYGVFDLVDVNKKFHQAKPMFIIKSRQLITTNTFVEELGLKFRFTDINVENGNFKFEISEKKSNKRDFVIMKAIVFPQINILWAGCILLVIGSWIAMRKRFKESYRE